MQKLKILPSTLAAMDDKEKAFIYASIMVRGEAEKKQASRMPKVKGARRR